MRTVVAALLIVMPVSASAQSATRATATAGKVTVLSTMLVGNSGANGTGEWGFAALMKCWTGPAAE